MAKRFTEESPSTHQPLFWQQEWSW